MSIRRTVNQSSSGAGFCGVVCAKGSWRSPPWLVRCTDRSPLIDDERRQISCRVRRMKPVRTVQRHFGIAAPCSAPGFAHREQHAADAFCGSRIRPAHRIECVPAIRLWPHHVERRPGAARPDDGVETDRPLAECDLRIWKRRWSLLQHDDRPAAFSDAALRRTLLPVVFEAESAEHHAGRADRRSSLARQRLDHGR